MRLSTSTPSPTLQGISYMIVAMLCFALMNSCIRFSAPHVNSSQLAFFRNFLAMLGMAAWIFTFHPRDLFKSQRIKSHLWRAGLGIISIELWFYAVAHMPLNEATALSFTSPLFASILAMLLLKEAFHPTRLIAIILGFLGMVVILRPTHLPDTTLALMVLASAALMAVGGTLIKSLTKNEHPDTIVFTQAALMTPMAIPLMIAHWQPLTPIGFGWACLVAFFSVTGHFCLTRAFARCDMVLLMPFDFMRLIFTAIFAALWFNERLDSYTALGAALIIGSSLWSTWLEKRRGGVNLGKA